MEIEKEELNAIKLTSDLVQIDSTDPGACEGEMVTYIEAWLRQNAPGVKIEKEEVVDHRYNLRAVLEGETGLPALIFICHMDTVVFGEGWKESKPLSGEIKEGKLYGRGSCDMKSGLACAMTVFAREARKAAEEGSPMRTLEFIATADEEDFMRGAEKAIASGWVTKDDWVLDMEPTDGKIRAAHKGRSWFELTVQGVTAHASTPYKGADAIAGLAEMICEIRKSVSRAPIHPELGDSTVTFGMVEGGYRPYVVPDHARVWIDMRLAPPLSLQQAEDIIKKAISTGEQRVPGVRGTYKTTGSRPYVEKDENSPLLHSLCEAVSAVTGIPAVVDIFPGYTDTAVIAGKLANHNCMSYGPGNLELAHKPDEYVDTEDICRCTRVIAALADSLLYKNLTLR
ncbi:MAG: M20 family metallopeptidase [Eubacteriales bacterium]|nr:M20 family metallopeptidase [Eubacteriales bacterium]